MRVTAVNAYDRGGFSGGRRSRLDEIYRYSRDQWGEDQAKAYLRGLFEACNRIDPSPEKPGHVLSRPVPAEFGVSGFVFRYESQMIYWRRLADGRIGVVTILHVAMHQIDRLKDDLGL